MKLIHIDHRWIQPAHVSRVVSSSDGKACVIHFTSGQNIEVRRQPHLVVAEVNEALAR